MKTAVMITSQTRAIHSAETIESAPTTKAIEGAKDLGEMTQAPQNSPEPLRMANIEGQLADLGEKEARGAHLVTRVTTAITQAREAPEALVGGERVLEGIETVCVVEMTMRSTLM